MTLYSIIVYFCEGPKEIAGKKNSSLSSDVSLFSAAIKTRVLPAPYIVKNLLLELCNMHDDVLYRVFHHDVKKNACPK